MSQRYSGSLSRPEINLTPLIDVLLVLLIIFMVITPVQPANFETKVPTPSSEGRESPGILVVSMAAGTLELSLNGQPLQYEQLAAKLADELQKRPVDSRVVFIRAPKRALYREVVRIVDLAKGAGADPTGLLVDYLED